MAAPSGIVWGSTVGSYGRIGIYTSLSSTDTTTSATVEVWFWSKFSVSDSNNSFYFDNLSASGSATTSKGSVSISTTSDSGGWSDTNQKRIASYSFSYSRGTSAVTRYLYAKLANVDRVGGTMYASTTFSVPALASYTVSYNANGGSGAPSSQSKRHGKALTLSSTKPTRTGYTFQGWATSASGSVAYAAGASYTANASVTLYAVWKANTYTVSYNANGGSGAPSSQTKTHGAALTLSSTKPLRTNYTFKGWGTSASTTTVSYAAGADYTTNASVTLYAIWELSYVKPRINNLSIERCDSSGELLEEGTCALVAFNWASDVGATEISIVWESASDTSGKITINMSGEKSGTVSELIDDVTFSTDSAYSFTITVTDSSGYSTAFGTLYGTLFTLDFLAGGRGAAFGKPAELEDVLDIAFQTKFTGGLLPLVLEPETDLNNVIIPNTYTGANISNNNYLNCPVTSGTFTLLVESCGESGQIKQTYTCCSKHKPERYSRFYYLSAWGPWTWANTDEVVLYESDSGSNTTITLNYSLTYFRYIEIYYTDNNGKTGGYTKVFEPDGKTICLGMMEAGSTIHYRQTTYAASGTSLTPNMTYAGYVTVNGTDSATVGAKKGYNYLNIVRVIGRA